MRRLTILALAAVIAVGCLAGCEKPITPPEKVTPPVVEYTDGDLVRTGESEYSIVIAPTAGNMTQMAAQELQTFLQASTYATLPVVTEAEWSEDAKYISIGDTDLLTASGLTPDRTRIYSDGFYVGTYGNSLFIVGGSDRANLYGVYGMLNRIIGLDFYAPDETGYEILSVLRLPDFDYYDNPDTARTRIIYTGSMFQDTTFMLRTRTEQWESVWTGVGGTHSTFAFLDPDEYRDAHSDWYARSADGSREYAQLCFTNDDMRAALTAAVIEEAEDYPDRDNLMIGIEDNRDYCRCPECTAVMNAYGGCASATVIQCVNRIAADVKAHFAGTRDDLKLVIFAYYGYLDAPVIRTEDGYAPIDETVVLADNVGVMIPPIDSNYSHSYYEEEYNQSERTAFEGWNVLTDSIYLWSYTTNFNYFLVPFDSYGAMQDNFRYYREHNVTYNYAQGQYTTPNSTGFVNLQTYLQSKLMWDADADFETLIDDFFSHYFRDAAPAMRRYFDQLRLHYAVLEKEQDVYSGIYYEILKREYWPQGLLYGWEDAIDEAYAAVEKYRESDPELYEKLRDRINLESISVRYLIIELYGGSFDAAEYRAYAQALKEDIEYLKISNQAEGSSVSELFDSWGV